MRSAKKETYFPYGEKTTCYILVSNDGSVKQVSTKAELSDAYSVAIAKKALLYAVWPGKYRSDLFQIDDLEVFADAVGIPRKDNHVHDLEWKLSASDDGNSRYALVNCKFNCNCSFPKMGIKKFALDMREQKGWVVAASTYWGINGDNFTVPVTRASLKKHK